MNRKILSFSYFVALSLGGCSTLPDMERAQLAEQQGNYLKAKADYQALADFGFPEAKLQLGDLYIKGQGVEKSIPLAIQQYLSVASVYPIKVNGRLGKAYAASSEMTQENFDLAESYFIELNQLSPASQAKIYLVRLHIGNPKFSSYAEVSHWIELSSKQFPAEANFYKGRLYSSGELVTVNPQLAADSFWEALSANAKAIPELIKLYSIYPELGEFTTLIKRLTESAAINSSRTLFYIGRVYAKGVVVEKDPVKAESYFSQALTEEDEALLALIKLYLNNSFLTNQDEFLATIQLAQDRELAKAKTYLAKAYHKGKFVLQDPFKAEELYIESMVFDPDATYELANLYTNGLKGEPEYEKAYSLYNSLVDAGYGKADYKIAEIFNLALGIKPNRPLAYAHYKLAKEQGIEKADIRLDEITADLSTRQLKEYTDAYNKLKQQRNL